MLTRRNLLQTAAAAMVPEMPALGVAPVFRHRGYLGWITDLDPRPDPQAPWPSMRLDGTLAAEYKQTFRLMRQLGYNNAVIWGLYVSRYWPTDLSTTMPPERGRLAKQVIDAAHAEGLRVVCGLGVFSWGFEKLIQAYPALSRTNPKAMCASNPEAWKWMEKITDYVFTRFNIDGVSMQSADLGRCSCSECSRFSDAEYHSRINIREAEYIRARHKNTIVAVSGWGMKFETPESLPFLIKMSEHLDYYIDVIDSTRIPGNEYQKKLIGQIRCDFGTIGGPLVEPPQHWERDRWFLPTARTQGEHLKELADNGGRACEYFFHIRANPGDEVSFWVAGKLLSDIGTPWQKHLNSTVEQLYKVSKPATAGGLAELFVEAEDAYMKRIKPFLSGDISMEPLVEDHAGPPIYLTQRLTGEARAQYGRDLQRIEQGFRRIAADIPEKTRISKILRCLSNVQRDLASLPA